MDNEQKTAPQPENDRHNEDQTTSTPRDSQPEPGSSAPEHRDQPADVQSQPSSDMVVVQFDNVYLNTDHGHEVFRDLTFCLRAGRTAYITGPAGSGKTSLIRLIIGDRMPAAGAVEVFGEVWRWRSRRQRRRIRRRIGGVGGLFDLMPSLTAAENITLPLIIAGLPRRQRQEKLLRVLGEFSLLKLANVYPERLTRVERTMVQFARAAVNDQPLLLIDEPTAGLDRTTYDRLVEYMFKVSQSGRSMIIVSSEVPSRELPNTDYYEIVNGALL
jgi:cell division transport system ATP-binding protein